jgi:hypothetical protein
VGIYNSGPGFLKNWGYFRQTSDFTIPKGLYKIKAFDKNVPQLHKKGVLYNSPGFFYHTSPSL